ncbi:hypothetical protein Deba_0409 [Desulfarculus baarsii DSM 2075]|uniref:2TM domain-containing protein n=1 Tax=Desulfarculus baarsii (strain ATCC 33931 / DSM 2075 / LMG 7858 / VKM B-1802 / 2st14) TaxID=644282 RepID=E1QDZ8_DESB2|nr:2TM domain-containing protein [Desulfarculus baarsii]ADK83784.1 hypothetical protein Deba_0409 [Desulfarculus baarsii DSM 2075]
MVDARLAIHKRVGVFVLVNGACLAINLLTGARCLWFWWAPLGTGVGLVGHAWRRKVEREVIKRGQGR